MFIIIILKDFPHFTSMWNSHQKDGILLYNKNIKT